MSSHSLKSRSIPVGIALSVAGYVALKKVGTHRQPVSDGDILHSEDHIETGADGEVTIGLADGSTLVVPAGTEAVLDSEVFDVAEIREMHSHNQVLESMQQAILNGEDPETALQIVARQQASAEPDSIFVGSVPEQYPADDAIGGDVETHSLPEMLLPRIQIGDITILEPEPGRGSGGHDTGDDTDGEGDSHDSGHDTGSGGSTHDSGHDTSDEGSAHDSGHDTVDEGSTHDSGHDTGDEGSTHDSGHDTGHDTGDEGSTHDSGHDSGGGAYSAGQGGGYGYAGGSLTSVAVFSVSLSAPTTRAVRVDFQTIDGTAVSGGQGVDPADYGHTSGTLVIPAGQTYGSIEVTIFGDRLVEADEQFMIRLSNPVNAIIADDTSIASILDSGHGEGETAGGEVLVGTEGDDYLETRGGADVLEGLGGDDTLIAGGGADVVRGGEGDDLIVGLGGPDELYGGPGDDEIIGHGGRDLIDAGPGDDIVYAGGAPDQVLAGPGDDFVNAEGGPDVVDGGEGNDQIYGGGGPDQLFGGEGDDVIRGEGGPDLIEGGAGNDSLYGGGGPDQLSGGEGADLLQGGGAGDVFRFESLDGQVDRILDFSQHDQIDLSAILDIDEGDPVSDYVMFSPNASEASSFDLSVNPSGSGNPADFQIIAVLENLSSEPDVDELLAGGNLVIVE